MRTRGLRSPAWAEHVVSDTHIRCAECGGLYKSLAGHLRVHGMNTAEYRAAHGLATSQSLISPALKRTKVELARDQYEENEGLRASPRNAVWRRRVLAGVRAAWEENRDRPGFLVIWREATARAAQSRSRRALDLHNSRAVALGYRGLGHLLARTWSLTDLELGRLVGMSESNAGYLRQKYGDRPETELTGGARRAQQYVRAIDRRYQERAPAAGYRSIAELLHRTRSLLTRELADLLGISVQAASRLRSDPSMARLRPGDGRPIEPTSALQTRRAQRNMANARPRDGEGERAWWSARHDGRARDCGYAGLEAMVYETIDMTSEDFGQLLGLSDEVAGQLRRAFYKGAPTGQQPRRQARRVVTQMRYDARARNLGYESMEHLLRDTRQLTLLQLQTLLGVSMGTAHRLRTRS